MKKENQLWNPKSCDECCHNILSLKVGCIKNFKKKKKPMLKCGGKWCYLEGWSFRGEGGWGF